MATQRDSDLPRIETADISESDLIRLVDVSATGPGHPNGASKATTVGALLELAGIGATGPAGPTGPAADPAGLAYGFAAYNGAYTTLLAQGGVPAQYGYAYGTLIRPVDTSYVGILSVTGAAFATANSGSPDTEITVNLADLVTGFGITPGSWYIVTPRAPVFCNGILAGSPFVGYIDQESVVRDLTGTAVTTELLNGDSLNFNFTMLASND